MMGYEELRRWLLLRQRKLYVCPTFYEGVIVGAYLCGAFNKKKYDTLQELLKTKVEIWRERESLKESLKTLDE